MKTPALSIIAIALSFGLYSAGTEKTEDEVYVFTSFREPADSGLRFLTSEDGLGWDSIPGTWLKPETGMNIMRDPSVAVGPDGTFHLVWTIAWKGDTGFGYASSKNLADWTAQRRIPAMDNVPSAVNVWAPELFYDDVKERFMIVFASCVPDAGFDNGIEDISNNHRLYYITTKDFDTFSEPELLYDPGFSCIDAIIVKRGTGDYAMVLKDNTRPNRNLKVAFAKSAEGPYGPASEAFTEPFSEGPSALKSGEKYYIYYDAYRKYAYNAVMTTDFINFTDATDSISVPRGHKHGTIFRAPRSVVAGLIDK